MRDVPDVAFEERNQHAGLMVSSTIGAPAELTECDVEQRVEVLRFEVFDDLRCKETADGAIRPRFETRVTFV